MAYFDARPITVRRPDWRTRVMPFLAVLGGFALNTILTILVAAIVAASITRLVPYFGGPELPAMDVTVLVLFLMTLLGDWRRR